MNELERTVLKAAREEWDVILQHFEIEAGEALGTYALLQTQYLVNGEQWMRTYVFAPRSDETARQIANGLVSVLESGRENVNRHYVLVNPEGVRHKTYFAGERPPEAPTPEPTEEPIDGVYLPPR